jgi:hypothetical protein
MMPCRKRATTTGSSNLAISYRTPTSKNILTQSTLNVTLSRKLCLNSRKWLLTPLKPAQGKSTLTEDTTHLR